MALSRIFSAFDKIVVSSPCDGSAYGFGVGWQPAHRRRIHRIQIITGSSDAPPSHFRNLSFWSPINGLVAPHTERKNLDNVWRIIRSKIRLLDRHNPAATHSDLQTLTSRQLAGAPARSRWHCCQHNQVGTLSQVMDGQSTTTSNSGPADAAPQTGGIDLTHVQLRYLSGSDETITATFQSPTGPSPTFAGTVNYQLSYDALSTWMALPDSTDWVNLSPGEPEPDC
jgi:hypothetical protein